jgi:hypothetical protein
VIHTRQSFTKTAIAAICKVGGSGLGPLPYSVAGTQLLWALSIVESSCGANCQPRHEPAYDTGGMYATHIPMPSLLQKFGEEGACSYGPWQLMLCNAPVTYSPSSFDDLTSSVTATVSFLNSLLRHSKPQSLADIGECWNAGHITPDPAYVSKLKNAYLTPMP